MLVDAAWRMGWQDWRQAGERGHFRCRGYYGVGFGEFNFLKVAVYKVLDWDVLTSFMSDSYGYWVSMILMS